MAITGSGGRPSGLPNKRAKKRHSLLLPSHYFRDLFNIKTDVPSSRGARRSQ
jgi:hypothetical protein